MVRMLLVWLITAEARIALALHTPRVVAITGNLGKTSAKDAIFAVLAPRGSVRKSQKSFNSDIGVPLAILGLNNPWSNPLLWVWTLVRGLLEILNPFFPKTLVLEVGADKPGDISSIAKWLRPHVAVFTGVPEIPVHVENFESREQLLQEKRALFEYLRPRGTIVSIADLSSNVVLRDISARRITYGFNPSCDVSASEDRVLYKQNVPVGVEARAKIGSEEYVMQMHGALGRPRMLSGLAGLAVAHALGHDLHSAISALKQLEPVPGRMRILRGVHGSVLIDDSYNASPAAAFAALDTLASIVPATRRIALLGDMRELGEYAARAHQELGERAAGVCDVLGTVGDLGMRVAEAAVGMGMKSDHVYRYAFGESTRAGKELAEKLQKGDVVLIKGSQSMRLERSVFELMEQKNDASRLLVRFDSVWRGKI